MSALRMIVKYAALIVLAAGAQGAGVARALYWPAPAGFEDAQKAGLEQDAFYHMYYAGHGYTLAAAFSQGAGPAEWTAVILTPTPPGLDFKAFKLAAQEYWPDRLAEALGDDLISPPVFLQVDEQGLTYRLVSLSRNPTPTATGPAQPLISLVTILNLKQGPAILELCGLDNPENIKAGEKIIASWASGLLAQEAGVLKKREEAEGKSKKSINLIRFMVVLALAVVMAKFRRGPRQQ